MGKHYQPQRIMAVCFITGIRRRRFGCKGRFGTASVFAAVSNRRRMTSPNGIWRRAARGRLTSVPNRLTSVPNRREQKMGPAFAAGPTVIGRVAHARNSLTNLLPIRPASQASSPNKVSQKINELLTKGTNQPSQTRYHPHDTTCGHAFTRLTLTSIPEVVRPGRARWCRRGTSCRTIRPRPSQCPRSRGRCWRSSHRSARRSSARRCGGWRIRSARSSSRSRRP